MDFLINDAMAQSGGGAAGGGLLQFLPLIVIVVIFYFLLIRPQQKRAKEHKQLVEGLGREDEILMSGGLMGRITEVGESFCNVEIADGVEVRMQKSAVSQVLPKGTLKQKLEQPAVSDGQDKNKSQDKDSKQDDN